jgi:predicted signal transduction protein with EAL and GGDEF domain
VVPGITGTADVVQRVEDGYRKIFGEPFQLGDTALRVSARSGLALYPDDGGDADTLLRNAEAALKKAKSGGDKMLFYARQMTERRAENLTLENKLQQALEKDEFVLHYQPKVDVETRRIIGVEALIRWQSPELGLVPPGKIHSAARGDGPHPESRHLGAAPRGARAPPLGRAGAGCAAGRR